MRKAKEAPPPYEKGTLWYGPILHAKENRYLVNIILPNGKRTSTSYARFLLQTHLSRFLTRKETVDHINENKLDDRLENLQILTHSDNNAKHRRHAKATRKVVELKCPGCGKIFTRDHRQTHLGKKGKFTTCSRSCCGRVRAMLKNKPQLIESNVISIYDVDSR